MTKVSIFVAIAGINPRLKAARNEKSLISESKLMTRQETKKTHHSLHSRKILFSIFHSQTDSSSINAKHVKNEQIKTSPFNSESTMSSGKIYKISSRNIKHNFSSFRIICCFYDGLQKEFLGIKQQQNHDISRRKQSTK